MRAHWVYLKYIIRHKWFVFLASRQMGCSLWRGIVHDWSKFLPREWFHYVHSFYNPDGSKRNVRDVSGAYDPTKVSREFDYAWKSHQRMNAHHWQHWVLINDEDGTYPLEIPERFVREMVADWIGAGRAISGRTDPRPWYEANAGKMILHQDTRGAVEAILAAL